MLVKLKRNKHMSATTDCTSKRELGALAFVAGSINAKCLYIDDKCISRKVGSLITTNL